MIGETVFPSIGYCIYCGRTDYADGSSRRLGAEHIIPESLNGSLVIEEASCKECEDITGHIETITCGHQLIGPRWTLNLKSKTPFSKRKRTIPIYTNDTVAGQRVDVDIDDFPSVLFLMQMGPPPILCILAGRPLETAEEVKPWFHWFNYDKDILLKKYGVSSFSFTRFDLRYFCRMLAKIAHSFAIANLGPRGFTPLLTDMIRDRNRASRESMLFVGCAPHQEPIEDALHTIKNGMVTISDGRRFHVVRIRLFAQLNAPTYEVIVGTPIELNIPPPPKMGTELSARHNFYRISVPASKAGET